jgi:hypothetical protein
MAGEDAGGGDEEALTLDNVRALIAQERGSIREELQKELAEGEEAREAAVKKAARFEKVIAAQAAVIADLQTAKADKKIVKPKLFCSYGTDGQGAGNLWPRRLLNEPARDEPHCFDLSEDKTYESLIGANRGFKYEYRTLACAGSYLDDAKLELDIVLGDLRAEGQEALDEQADKVENTFAGVIDLLASRFGLIKELVAEGVTAQRKAYLQEKLYPREGVTGPASSLQDWNVKYDSAYAVQLEKQLAIEAARTTAKNLNGASGSGGGGGGGGGGASTPKPRTFTKGRNPNGRGGGGGG